MAEVFAKAVKSRFDYLDMLRGSVSQDKYDAEAAKALETVKKASLS